MSNIVTVSHRLHGAVQYSTVLDPPKDGQWNDNWRAAHRYAVGFSPPNYPVPAIPHYDMLINWHGKHKLVVVHPNQHSAFRGYATFSADYNLL